MRERLGFRSVSRRFISALAVVALAGAAMTATAGPATATNLVVVSDPVLTLTFTDLNVVRSWDAQLQAYRWNVTGRIQNRTSQRRAFVLVKIEGLNSQGSLIRSTENSTVSSLPPFGTLPWSQIMYGDTITTFRMSAQSEIDTSIDRTTPAVSLELGTPWYSNGRSRVQGILVNTSPYPADGTFYVAGMEGVSGQQVWTTSVFRQLPALSRTPYEFVSNDLLPKVTSVTGWVRSWQDIPIPPSTAKPVAGPRKSQHRVAVKSSVKVKKVFMVAGRTNARLSVAVRTRTPNKCRVVRSHGNWKVKGRRKGICRLKLTAPGNNSWKTLRQRARVRVK